MAQTLQRTPLYERHVALGARMVPFAGWDMPVQYEGVIPEHRAVRTDAGAFDVSHMGEIEVEGPARARAAAGPPLERSRAHLEAGEAQYTLLTNERGGIIDDLIVYRLDAFRFLLVVNASNRAADFRWLKEREISGSDVRDVSDEYALIAVQGPNAIEKLGLPPARQFTFAEDAIDGVEAMVNRTGYTGEDGCEILCMARTPSRSGMRCSPAASCRAGSARATPCVSRSLSAPRQRHRSWTDADRGRPRLDVRARQGVHRRRRPAAGQGRRARARLVAFVMEEKAVPRQGMPIVGDGRRRRDVGLALADARRRDRHGVCAGRTGGARHTLTIDVRGKSAARRAS